MAHLARPRASAHRVAPCDGRGRRGRPGARHRAPLVGRDRRAGARLRPDDRPPELAARPAGAVREARLHRSDGRRGGPRPAEPAGQPARRGPARPAPRRRPGRPRAARRDRGAGRSTRSPHCPPAAVLPARTVPPPTRECAGAGRRRARRIHRAVAPAQGRARAPRAGRAPGHPSRPDAPRAGPDGTGVECARRHAGRWPARGGHARRVRLERRGRRGRSHGLGSRHRAGDPPQPVRAVLHDAARGDGSGTRDRQALRGGSRRPARHREHRGPRHDGADLAPQRERRRRAASPAGTERRVSGSTVLIVDDEQSLARSAKAFLADHGYEAEVAGTGEQALELLATLQPDVVFADVRLPGMSGLDLLKRIRAFDPVIPVIMLTAYGSIAGAVEAVKLGAFDYVKKPVDLEELKLLADRARETRLLKEELSYYRRRATTDVGFEGLVGESRAVQAVLERARQVAALDETPPVLLTGETGTGKGLLARAIHAAGARATKPFIEVNCTALPATLMEAELFGHERGAFTDAKESKPGLVEAAEGGFLFLDEIGDVDLSVQGKLLRAIEERAVRRVGSVRERKIDVRIIAATNRDLDRAVRQERFRKDLYFRLAVIVLELPPLRARGEDVLLLTDHYVRLFNAKYGKVVRELSAAARDLLRSYPWPGNVRELSHVIERAVLWSRGPTLEVEHLSLTSPTDAGPGEPRESAAVAAPAAAAPRLPPQGVDLGQWEKSVIEQAMREAGGNQTKAARRLGISRDTLRYRLRKFGLQP